MVKMKRAKLKAEVEELGLTKMAREEKRKEEDRGKRERMCEIGWQWPWQNINGLIN